MNNPFTNMYNASRFNSVQSSGTKSTVNNLRDATNPFGPEDPSLSGGMPPPGGGSGGGSSREAALAYMNNDPRYADRGKRSKSSSTTSTASGGTGGGSGGGSGGGGGDPYAGMPAWLQQYYQQGGIDSWQMSSDGFFTSGGDLRDILFGEAGQMQGAADRHFNRVLEREDQLEAFLDGIQGYVDNVRIDTSLSPDQYASVLRAEQEYNAFEDRTAQDISSTVAGHQAQFASQIDQINTGMRPDGTMMTAQEQADQRFRLDQSIGVATQQAVGTIMSSYNREKAALGMQVASMTGQAEQLRQQAQMVNAANQMQALQLENQGRQALAQLTLNNPETVVSVLNGLLALNEHGVAMDQLFGSGSGGAMGNAYFTFANEQRNLGLGLGRGSTQQGYVDPGHSFADWLRQNGYSDDVINSFGF